MYTSLFISASLLALRTWLIFASCFCLFWGPTGDDCLEFENVSMILKMCVGVFARV